ncbi:MAG TPA: 6-bladed beta-propeller [Candidatus Bacteroides avicola]|uniref:6-bladed beta-propeller n=1 Tax=Candidatus Bacteroides avicola TaxID=2838468 RepID=A0A9D2KW18_9BACE|nr:6-bladed beta-propeller [Candidatus Bacteroides avicola]
MKAVKLWGLSALAMVLGACGGNQSAGELTLDNLPVVATMEAVGQDSVCVLHLDKLGKDTLTIALSQYLEDFRLVRLDNRDEALTRGGGVCLGNYFITGGGSREACRLFDKDGRFLFRVGNNGQGPGEYWAVYDKQIDEQNRRIYLMPWNATSLLVYDLDTGAYLSSIPLPTMVPKGVFTVDAAKQTVIVGMLPFNDIEGARVVWQQDFEGNVLQGIDATPYAVVPDFSNEVSNMDNMEGTFDFYLFTWVTQADTLYHYIAEENRLKPVFTLNMPGDPIQHSYTELPDCYLMDVTLEWAQNQYGTYVSKRAIILVDKRTGRGGFVQFVNDKVGNLPVDNAAFLFNNGYFMQSIEPGELALRIDEALSSPGGLTLKQQDELKSLRASINEDDNTYLFVGKLK